VLQDRGRDDRRRVAFANQPVDDRQPGPKRIAGERLAKPLHEPLRPPGLHGRGRRHGGPSQPRRERSLDELQLAGGPCLR
jgi:hypothetical protein